MSRRSMRKELEALRAQVQQGQQQSQNAGGAQGPSVIGSTTSQGSFNRRDPGGTFSYSNRNPQTMQMMQGGAQQGLDALKELLSQKFNFGPIAQQARTNFAQTTIPSIAERFSSLGTGGSQRSSAFPQLLSQGGAGLEEALAALQEQYGLQEKGLNAGIAGQMYGIGTQPMWETGYRQGSPSGRSQLFNQFITNAGQAVGKIGGAALMA